jgi:hypothetical protein
MAFMRTISEQKAGRTDGALGWSLRIMGFTRVLAGICFFALLHNPVQALSATVQAGQGVAIASWNPSPSPTVVGYNIYYGAASGTYTNLINAGNTTNATVSGLTAGTTYYFAITAYTSTGIQSSFSSEVSYTAVKPGSVITSNNVVIGPSKLLPNGQFQLTINGGVSGQSYVLLASTNLVNWTPIRGFVDTNPPVTIYDPDAANYRRRFYRIGPLSLAPAMTLGLNSGQRSSSNGFNMVLSSLPGLNYEIEASTDLVNWVIITNFMTTNSPSCFGDPQAKNYQQRFYRAVMP